MLEESLDRRQFARCVAGSVPLLACAGGTSIAAAQATHVINQSDPPAVAERPHPAELIVDVIRQQYADDAEPRKGQNPPPAGASHTGTHCIRRTKIVCSSAIAKLWADEPGITQRCIALHRS